MNNLTSSHPDDGDKLYISRQCVGDTGPLKTTPLVCCLLELIWIQKQNPYGGYYIFLSLSYI